MCNFSINNKGTIMKTKNMFYVLATLLFTSSGIALAANSNFLNGQPFKALNESIQANSDAIADNTTAINDMATEVDALFTQVAAIDTRVTANEVDIAAALAAIDAAASDISSLATSLYNLQASVSLDIAAIEGEISTIQGNITTLNSNLAALSAAVTTQVGLLSTAITDNTADILIHTANLTILNSNMATVQTAITLLQGRVTQTESDLASQQVAIDNLASVLGTMDVRVTELELLHPDSDAREITVIDVGTGDDLIMATVQSQFSTLNFQSGDYLYIYGAGASGITEFCSNDLRVKQAIDGFLGNYNAGNYGYYSSDTWLKRNSGWTFEGNQYTSIRNYVSGTYQFLDFYASGNGVWGQIHLRPNESYYELYVSGWGYGQSQSATYRAASTRLDACGF